MEQLLVQSIPVMQNSYALTLILKPEMGEKERKELLEAVTKNFGKLVKEDLWGVRDLSYPIKKQKKGFYAHYLFLGEPKDINPLDKQLKMEEDIIRYLLVRI